MYLIIYSVWKHFKSHDDYLDCLDLLMMTDLYS